MADVWEDLIEGEVVDCSTLSVNYQPSGLATIGLTIYREKSLGAPYTEGGPGFEMCFGGVRFRGYVTDQSIVPESDIEYIQWRVSAICIGCRDICVPTGC